MEVEPRGNILQLYEIIRQSKIRTSMNRFVMSVYFDSVDYIHIIHLFQYMLPQEEIEISLIHEHDHR
jgi:hypothetical protein